MRGFIAELRDRHVTGTALVYVVAGFGLIEFIDIVGPVYGIPVGVEATLIKLVIAGLPVALLCAWLLEIRSGGIRLRPRSAWSGGAWLPAAVFTVVIASAGFAVVLLPGSDAVGAAEAGVPAAPAGASSDTDQPGDGPRIVIHTPSTWANDGSATLRAPPQQAIRLKGQVSHAPGIDAVLANGRRLSIARTPGGGVVSFSGFVDPPQPGSSGELQILARGMDGMMSVRTYRIATPQATSAAAESQLRSMSRRQRWAVVIGVGEYRDPTIVDLKYAADDARSFHDFLRSPAAGLGGVPENHVTLLVDGDATARNIRSALTTFLRQSTPDDVILIYLVGHGTPDPYRPGDLYLVAHDTEIGDLAGTGIAMGDLNEWIREAYAYNKILLSDVGHWVGGEYRARPGGDINTGLLEYMDNSSGGFVAFTAAEANQLSREGEQFGGGHGIFTHFILEGLRGAADHDGDRVITLSEMMEFTRDRVRRTTRNAQIPTISLTTYDRFWPVAIVLDP